PRFQPLERKRDRIREARSVSACLPDFWQPAEAVVAPGRTGLQKTFSALTAFAFINIYFRDKAVVLCCMENGTLLKT
ncbi:MAG: hypothetical protein Q4D98_11470, partial [Planctomycetia bacterium]|nr:hypothetical protein [Planctomycetia bacterium]